MFVQRRISSAFREIPGGQILGPTRDYTQRLLNPALARSGLGSIDAFLGVTTGTHTAEELRAAGATMVFPDLAGVGRKLR